MKTHRFKLPSSVRLVISEGLIITLITLLSLPAAFATPREAAKTVALPLAGLIVVNVSNDADNLDPLSGCDTDAATPGEQCSLRAAIQRANVLAGEPGVDLLFKAGEV